MKSVFSGRNLASGAAIAFLVVLSFRLAIAQQSAPDTQVQKVPRFADYEVREFFRGTPAQINPRSHHWASEFHTVLADGARKGPNFARYFTVVYWGCGTSCQAFAIIDARSGDVLVPTGPNGGVLLASVGLNFRKDSSLLILDPIEKLEKEHPQSGLRIRGSLFYVWKDKRLRHIFTLFPSHTSRARDLTRRI